MLLLCDDLLQVDGAPQEQSQAESAAESELVKIVRDCVAKRC